MTMTILIRVDADPTMGAGHLMRCIALAYGFEARHHHVYFLLNEDTQNLAKQSESFQFNIIPLNSSGEISQISKLCKAYSIDVMVLDGYHFDEDYRHSLKAICARSGALLAILDDCNNKGRIAADFVINSVGQAGELGYEQTAPEARLLLGSDYTLLRPEFLRGRTKSFQDADSLVLCFGASDIKGLSLPLCQALLTLTDIPKVIVVSGVAYQLAHKLDELASKSNQRLRHLHNVSDMSTVMQEATLFVSAAGSTSFELSALAVPSLFVVVADNQLNAAKSHEAKHWSTFFDARDFNDQYNEEPNKEPNDVIHSLASTILSFWQDEMKLTSWHQTASCLPNIDGANNVVLACEKRAHQALLSNIESLNIVLREVCAQDLERVRTWRNDKDIAQYMIDQRYISEDQQKAWYSKIQYSLSQQHFIIMFRDEAIGVVNIKSSDGRSLRCAKDIETGLYIYDARYRGNFLAFCPALVINDYCFNHLKADTLTATVLAGNEAALKFNIALGYQEKEQTTIEFDARQIPVVKMSLEKAKFDIASQKIRRLIR